MTPPLAFSLYDVNGPLPPISFASRFPFFPRFCLLVPLRMHHCSFSSERLVFPLTALRLVSQVRFLAGFSHRQCGFFSQATPFSSGARHRSSSSFLPAAVQDTVRRLFIQSSSSCGRKCTSLSSRTFFFLFFSLWYFISQGFSELWAKITVSCLPGVSLRRGAAPFLSGAFFPNVHLFFKNAFFFFSLSSPAAGPWTLFFFFGWFCFR